ncbi:flagellar biosynthesis protein FliQ [Photobacterium lutimaris]|uniref:Flagellar biosynthetic protein FliQ n=1 Tax=Photobacterium lutimaris TaxID=388278 RepID=A0A2T3IV56_9GAMM|nr:flagellar biosynthesis protein FliQ [Photobacterium lutimaris]PSU32278.1 flagellar biosynthetic protein FliQ [Photobacterium lutimaris]TDR73152.1 flagellar biosynthetic protein FliQ [Photobacterium lutimaris]
MGVDATANLYADAIYMIISMVVILIGPSLLVGLVVAVFQATTQINEQTMSFLPRLLTTLLMLIFTGPWLLRNISDFFTTLFHTIANVVS